MLGPDWRPKEAGDYRLSMLGEIGLKPPPDVDITWGSPSGPYPEEGRSSSTEVPYDEEQPQQHPLARKASVARRLGSKDPLAGMKSLRSLASLELAPAVAAYGRSGGMRRVQTMPNSAEEELRRHSFSR